MESTPDDNLVEINSARSIALNKARSVLSKQNSRRESNFEKSPSNDNSVSLVTSALKSLACEVKPRNDRLSFQGGVLTEEPGLDASGTGSEISTFKSKMKSIGAHPKNNPHQNRTTIEAMTRNVGGDRGQPLDMGPNAKDRTKKVRKFLSDHGSKRKSTRKSSFNVPKDVGDNELFKGEKRNSGPD